MNRCFKEKIMTDLRDKIAKIVSVGCMHHWHTKTIADAILALPEIADLQKKLDRQIGYKEDYCVSYMGAMDDWAKAEARIDELEAIYVLKRAECDGVLSMLLSVQQDCIAAEAAIPRAYQMGLDAAAKWLLASIAQHKATAFERGTYPIIHEHTIKSIRDLTPPADLVQQATKGTDHE